MGIGDLEMQFFFKRGMLGNLFKIFCYLRKVNYVLCRIFEVERKLYDIWVQNIFEWY